MKFAEALKAAMAQRQVTLSMLRDRLAARGHPISLTALSYWRSGQREPEKQASLEAIPEIEALLALAPGSLSRLIHGPAGRRLGRVERFDKLLDYPVIEPVQDSNVVGEGDVSRVATQLTVEVGAQREIVRTRTRRVVVANRDGVEGFTMFMGTDLTDNLAAHQFRAVAGCAIGQISKPARNIRSVWLQFPRALMLGESAITEVEVSQAEGAALELDTDYEVAAEQRLEEAMVWVTFAPSALPTRCWVYFTEGDLTQEWLVDIEGTNSAHCRQRDFGPGSLGIRWQW